MVRILVLTDIHANREALEAVITDAGQYDAIWCLGDMIGYGPDPVYCLQWAREHCAVVLAGNHDVAAYDAVQLARFNSNALAAAEWTNAQLGSEDREYLRSLPSRCIHEGVTLAHGSPASPPEGPVWTYILTVIDAVDAFAAFDGPLCFVGHTHVAGMYRKSAAGTNRIVEAAGTPFPLTDATDATDATNTRYIINPGSVGQPRDRNPDAAYLLYNPDTQQVTWRRVPYNRATTQAKMRVLSFPDRLITRLDRGM